MSSLWPWLAVAGIGALHGLNPATGWAFAAAWGVRSGDGRQAVRALVPIAIGHAASVVVVATAVSAAVLLGPSLDLVVVQILTAGLVVIGAAGCLASKAVQRSRSAAGHVKLALWSFVVSTVQGSGLMLVPALVPLCMGDAAVREITVSGSFALALAAVGVHTAAMLAVTGVMAAAACCSFNVVACRRLQPGPHLTVNGAWYGLPNATPPTSAAGSRSHRGRAIHSPASTSPPPASW